MRSGQRRDYARLAMNRLTVEAGCWVHGSSLDYSTFLFSVSLNFSLLKSIYIHIHNSHPCKHEKKVKQTGIISLEEEKLVT